jgi:hypothetical protein
MFIQTKEIENHSMKMRNEKDKIKKDSGEKFDH